MADARVPGALLVLLLLLASGSAGASPQQIASSAPIPCSATPFGQRLTLGLEHEYAVVRGDGGSSSGLIGIHDGPSLTIGASRLAQASGFATLPSLVSTPVDLDGDGTDELAIAGIKNGDAHTVVVRTIWQDAGQAGGANASANYEFTAAQNILDLRVAAADVTGRDSDARQELIVAYRDAANTTRVLVLNGIAGSHAIQQASNAYLAQWTMPADPDGFTNLRLATGDVLLEGRDQIVLMGLSTFFGKRVYYVLRYDDNSGAHLSHARYSETRPFSDTPAGFFIHIADLGGTAAAEIVVHDQEQILEGGGPGNIHQEVKYFTTTRDSSNAITAVTFHNSAVSNTISVTTRPYAVAVGELDRQPGAEIVVAVQRDGDIDNNLLVELFKVGFDFSGHAASIGPYLAPTAPFNPIVIDAPMYRSFWPLLDVTIGQPNKDGIGEVAVVLQDQLSQGNSTPITKIRAFAMARPSPNPNVNPDPTTFALRRSFDYPSTPVPQSLSIGRLDFDGDSVLADIDASNCLEVREPMLRSVVHLPPYWQLLQAGSGNFLAMIGKSITSGATNESKYGTFTSHDVSAYVGVKVGGEVMGIGAEASAKVTAGYNYQSSRGESYGSENALSVSESQQQDHGEGLVVEEDNTFDCYTYNVHSLGENDPGSSVRSCELIRYVPGTQTELRGFTASDMVTWDTDSAYNLGLGQPAQWVPLAPDWASIALFHQPTAVNFGALITDVAKVTDGQFGTSLISPSMAHPYVQIDLGTPKLLTNVRIFPAAGHQADLQGFSLYVSKTPYTSDAPPSGAGVTVFAPDPSSGNGFDHWNVWLRDQATQAPLLGRFLRLQSSGPENHVLAISEIEAFADVHIEPPQYPVSVCDPTAGDGRFTALMYDAASASYRKVDVRGDLLWKGTAGQDARCAAADNANVKKVDIWSSTTIGGSGFFNWDLTNTSGSTVGTNTSIEHSYRVGAELDVEAGAVVKAQAGGAYEFSSGVTEESATTMYWQSGIEYSGQVGGFATPAADCNYRAQPFAYTTAERSNIGYEHQYTAVDYFVPDFNWSRNGVGFPTVPTHCYVTPPDRFFYGGFETSG